MKQQRSWLQQPCRRIPKLGFLFALLGLAAGQALAAEPYIPGEPGVVLLSRPAGAAKALRVARAELAVTDVPGAVTAVQALIEQGRRSGDPRYFGQAQARLGNHWYAQAPPIPLRLLRATLLQQRHDFDAALLDLQAVLAAEPQNAQAHLIRANIYMVRGLPQQARPDCAALISQASLLVAASCIAAVGSLSGQAESGMQALELALTRSEQAPENLRVWAHTQAAEIAERLGDVSRAEKHYATAVTLAERAGNRDVYLQAAQADFLLGQQRAAEVVSQLQGLSDSDPLLLRLALAEAQLGRAGDVPAAASSAQHLQELLQRYTLARLRGDTPHLREQGMAALHLQHDSALALTLAEQSWAVQREPADAMLLLQAALAAGKPAAAQPVIDWMRATGIQDLRLQALKTQWASLP
jgi:tetratricopeptide (TPR) repeat protein